VVSSSHTCFQKPSLKGRERQDMGFTNNPGCVMFIIEAVLTTGPQSARLDTLETWC
jgi:hypothetical protein